MTSLVVDASVILKWFLDEDDTPLARALPQLGYELLAPSSLPLEVANGLWNAQRRERAEPEDAALAVELLRGLKVSLVPIEDVLSAGYGIAVAHDRTVYDCLYVALALREGCQFVTADERLYNALRDALPGTIARLADIAGAEEDEAIT